ncbi:MAG: ExbD/TolR family protein [Xenococcaceae cyanobacterium]
MTSTSKVGRKKVKSAAIAARPMRLQQDRGNIEQEVRIEILPLIDVIFCILTFFILAAVGLSRQQAISLNLPKASTGTPQMREMLVVSLDDIGQIYVEQQLVTRSQLDVAIRNYHQNNPSALMVLHASRNASYNDVVQILDRLREVGGNRVALATLPAEAKKSDNFTPSNGSIYPNNSLNPYGETLPGGTYNRDRPGLPLPPSQGLGNPQYNPTVPSLPSLPSLPNNTSEQPKIPNSDS